MADRNRPWIPDYMIKDATIRWRNFAGREGRFNQKGDRNFTIFLEPEDAARLSEMGLNVKTLPPREEGEPGRDILKVKVNFKGRPPRLVLVTHKGRTFLDEDSAGLLDSAQIKKVDLILSPYYWEIDGTDRSGIAVSVKALYKTIVEDELEMAYSDIPEASGGAMLNTFEYTPDEAENE